MAALAELSREEQQIIQKLRWLRATYANFQLHLYGQGSASRQVLDMSWEPRVRLSTTPPLPTAVDD